MKYAISEKVELRLIICTYLRLVTYGLVLWNYI